MFSCNHPLFLYIENVPKKGTKRGSLTTDKTLFTCSLYDEKKTIENYETWEFRWVYCLDEMKEVTSLYCSIYRQRFTLSKQSQKTVQKKPLWQRYLWRVDRCQNRDSLCRLWNKHKVTLSCYWVVTSFQAESYTRQCQNERDKASLAFLSLLVRDYLKLMSFHLFHLIKCIEFSVFLALVHCVLICHHNIQR